MAARHILLFFSMFLIKGLNAQYTKEIYVAPYGTDKSTGNFDEPFKTLHRAYDEIASLHNTKYQSIVLWLNDGIYRIKNPLVIDAMLKKSNIPISFKAMDNAKPVISGAYQLTGWRNLGDNLWACSITHQIETFRELFINGQRTTRARHPNSGYLRVNKVGADKRTHFTFNAGDFPIPTSTVHPELVLLHDWSITRIPVKNIDQKKNVLHTIDSIGAKNLSFFTLDNWEPNPRYYLENAPEFLDADYEWYFDAPNKEVRLKLPSNFDPNSLTIEIPVAERLIQVRGSVKKSISNVSFEGISFKYCRWNPPEETYAGIQACHFDPRGQTAEWNVVPAAIQTQWADNVRFENCEFLSMGGSAVWFGTGSTNCALKNCRIYDISGNGIMIGEGRDRAIGNTPWWKTAPEQVARANSVESCDVSNCGVQFYGAVGIWCGLTAETVLRNNDIYNLPYTGISIGWMWSPQSTPCRDNIVAQNHIHHILRKLSDGGGVYLLGLQPGTRLTENHIHDISVNAGRAESNGMFLDEGTKDVLVEKNLIYNIAKSPLRFHKASTNTVKGNYFFSKENTPGIAYNRTAPENIVKVENLFKSTDNPDDRAVLKKLKTEFEKVTQSSATNPN
ncbi:right-handed parallel beta-helix repeat-containing protein [uncultured Kriegella sp.]|uniref:right-handed parallel beta-helix repeat-containing protein n=1 Tax=uncultured Kriegella sp. TaxID=1798910 RepID=UPI0030D6D392|tara:strand:+ start:65832 stop:67685 length:1854 start_codon:yes stop_codon:yes gene_type:complete